jgi:hypothetical protein
VPHPFRLILCSFVPALAIWCAVPAHAQADDFRCPSCGAVYEPWASYDLPVPTFHTLDGRSDTDRLDTWVCPVCFYACSECGWAERPGPISAAEAAVLQSPAYRAVLDGPYPDRSKALLLAALLGRARGDLTGAARNTLKAAWACLDDDLSPGSGGANLPFDEEGGVNGSHRAVGAQARPAICRDLRARAVTRYEKALAAFPASESELERMHMSVVLVDLYRRTGAFPQAEALCDVLLRQAAKGYSPPAYLRLPVRADEGRGMYREMLQYQKALIVRKDTREHRVGGEERASASSSGTLP